MEKTTKRILKSSLTGSFLGILLSINLGFAATSDCRNPLDVTIDGSIKMKFCEVPASYSVMIGSEEGRDNEKPVIRRDFERSFHMGQYEVTQAQFKALMDSEPWKDRSLNLEDFVKEGDNYPAVYITHQEAYQFARILSFLDESATYRLPTEAEWEYSARAGSETHYYWGDVFDANFAFYSGNSTGKGEFARLVDSCPTRILSARFPGYCANPFGLMHMAGNVWEYTADKYKDSYVGAAINGHIAYNEQGKRYVVRGGGFRNSAIGLRSANRSSLEMNGRSISVGFRLVRIVE